KTTRQHTHKLSLVREIAALAAALAVGLCTHPAAAAPTDSPPSPAKIRTGGIYFEPNVGQSPASVQFLARGTAENLALTDRGLLLQRQGQPVLDLEFAGASNLVPSGVARLPGVSHYRVGDDARHWHSDVPHFERLS